MAPQSLRRRRGTKGAGGSSQQFIQKILGGLILIGFGLIGGLMIGFLFFGSPEASAQALNAEGDGADASVANLLRGKSKQAVTRVRNAEAKVVSAIKFGERVIKEKGAKIPKLISKHLGGNNKHANTEIAALIKNLGTTKEAFLGHTATIGTFGTTPYIGDAVSEDHDFSTFTAPGGSRFEEYRFGDSPYTYGPTDSDEVARTRRYFIKRAMKHAWGNYHAHAFGMDELLPVSMAGSNGWGGQGTTLLDSLDTLWLMGMHEEFEEAKKYVAKHTSFQVTRPQSVFETTIRSLGGLLAAYDWSGDEIFKSKADELGSKLAKAFNTPSGLPNSQITLATGQTNRIGWTGGSILTAEAGTLQLEFRMLAKVTGYEEYATKADNAFEILRKMQPPNGLYPYMVRTHEGSPPTFGNQKLTFGAMSDSFYEYMLKIWLQGGKVESKYRDMYDLAIQGMHDELLQVSTPSGLVFIADKNGGRYDTKMDHLVCFMGGLLALGAYTDPLGLESERAQRDLKTGKALTYTCYQMYARMNTGISPEFVQFVEGQDFRIGGGAPHYLLRPETVESFFILHHLTKDPVYREWGWEVFQAIERYCRTNGGYGELKSVADTMHPPRNKMESFFLAETVKYLYLLFDPETEIDLLNKHVFNTEAHPMRIFPLLNTDV